MLVAKAFAANGTASSSNLLAAGQWLSDPDGDPGTADQPAVINDSWGGSAANDPWFRQMVRRWVALGIAPVFAAGNAGPAAGTVGSPADYPESIAVGAMDQSGAVATFSSVGPGVWTDPDHTGPPAGTVLVKPNLVAPGASILSLVGTSYQAWSGTSMAAPHVSGVIALMHQANPGLSVAQVASLLQSSARDVPAPGPDPLSGYGMVDAPAAVAAALATPAAAAPLAVPAAPAPAAPATAPVPAVTPAGPPLDVTPARPVTRLLAASRVSRRGRGLVVRADLGERARVVASLRAPRRGSPSAGVTRSGSGSLTLVLRVRGLRPGPHVLRVLVQGSTGQALEPAISRPVMVTR